MMFAAASRCILQVQFQNSASGLQSYLVPSVRGVLTQPHKEEPLIFGKLEELDEDELASFPATCVGALAACQALKVLEDLGPLAAASARRHSPANSKVRGMQGQLFSLPPA